MVRLFRFNKRRRAKSSLSERRVHADVPPCRQPTSYNRNQNTVQHRAEPSIDTYTVTSTFGAESARELHLANQTFVPAEPIGKSNSYLHGKGQSMPPRVTTTSRRIPTNQNTQSSNNSEHPRPNTGHRRRRLGLQEDDCMDDQCSILAPSFRNTSKQNRKTVPPKRKRKQDQHVPSASRTRKVMSSIIGGPNKRREERKEEVPVQSTSTSLNTKSSKIRTQNHEPNVQHKKRLGSTGKKADKPPAHETQMIPSTSSENRNEEVWNALELHPKLQQALLDAYWQRREQELLENAVILGNREESKLEDLNPQVARFLLEQGMALESIYELQKQKELERFEQKRQYFDTPESQRSQAQMFQSRSSQRAADSENPACPPSPHSIATKTRPSKLTPTVAKSLEHVRNLASNSSSSLLELTKPDAKTSTFSLYSASFASAETPDTRPLIFKEIPTGKEGCGQIAAVGRPLPDWKEREEEQAILKDAPNKTHHNSLGTHENHQRNWLEKQRKSEAQLQHPRQFAYDELAPRSKAVLNLEESGLELTPISISPKSSTTLDTTSLPAQKPESSQCIDSRHDSPISIEKRTNKQDARHRSETRSHRVPPRNTASSSSSAVITVSPMNIRKRISDITMYSPPPKMQGRGFSTFDDFDEDEEYEYEVIEDDDTRSNGREELRNSSNQDHESYIYEEIIDNNDVRSYGEKNDNNAGLNPEDFEYYYEEVEESYSSDEIKSGRNQNNGTFSAGDYMNDEQLKIWMSTVEKRSRTQYEDASPSGQSLKSAPLPRRNSFEEDKYIPFQLQQSKENNSWMDERGSLQTEPPVASMQTTFTCACCCEVDKSKESEGWACSNLHSPHLICSGCIEQYIRSAPEMGKSIDLLASNSVCQLPCFCHMGCTDTIHVDLNRLFSSNPQRFYQLQEQQRQRIAMRKSAHHDPSIRVEGQNEGTRVAGKIQLIKSDGGQQCAVNAVQKNMQKALQYFKRAMNEALSSVAIRSCPHCGQAFVKNDDGCNKMTCPTCKTTSCYCCRQVIPKVGYDHFENRLGANKYCLEAKCPLWTDDSVDETRDHNEMRKIIMDLANSVWEEHLNFGVGNSNSELSLGRQDQFSDSSIDSSVEILIAKLPFSDVSREGDKDGSSRITRISI